VETKVVIRAMTTKMVKVLVLRMFAARPMFYVVLVLDAWKQIRWTQDSERDNIIDWRRGWKRIETHTSTISSTRPLQLIRTPIAMDSLHTSPFSRAPTVALKNFAKKAVTVTATTYAHVMPLFSRPISVFKPDSVK